MKNHGQGHAATYGGQKGQKTNTGASTGLKMSKEMRSDTTKAPTNKNPFPKGMS